MLNLTINYLYNYTGIIPDFESGVSRLVGKEVHLRKPFSCPGCMIFWCSMIGTLIMGLNPIWVFPVSLLNHSVTGLFNRLIELLLTLLNKI